MYVRVLAKDKTPLMPTNRCGKVRHLLETGKAVAIRTRPFTIRLKYETTKYVQDLYGGVDPGRENIGAAVSKEDGENVYLADIRTNNRTVHHQMVDRAGFRRERRRYDRQNKQRKAKHDGTEMTNGEPDKLRTTHDCISRKITYPGAEKPVTHKVILGKEGKFNNRRCSEYSMTPSARQLVQMIMAEVRFMVATMPIKHLSVERVVFEFQKLDNANIHSWKDSKGPRYGYSTYRDYIYEKQRGRCPFCGGEIQQYHHILPRHSGGTDTVKNILGVCKSCHKKIHNGEITEEMLRNTKDGITRLFEVSLLNSVMPVLLDELAAFCEKRHIELIITDGHATSLTREKYHLPKDHSTDAYCISLAGRDVDPSSVKLDDHIYRKRRFKKKSKNIIGTRTRRIYYDGKKPVAYNRHKAMNQKEDSLEEYMAKYRQSHTASESDAHFRSLTVKPARRIYTYHKLGLPAAMHPGDIVRYTKTIQTDGKTSDITETFVVWAVVVSGIGYVRYENRARTRMIKYCRPIQAGALQCIGMEKTTSYLQEAAYPKKGEHTESA